MLILSHIGSKIPNHVKVCLEQTRKFYDGDIVFVTDNPDNKLSKSFNINFHSVDFNNDKFNISKSVNFNSYPNKNFWLYSLARLFFIEDFVKKNKIENFVIYENDIMIYSNLNQMIDSLSVKYENIAFTIGDDFRATTGFSFFKSYKDLIRLNDDIIKIIESPDDMKDIHDNYSSCCPSEMVFIRKISKDKDYIDPLPLFPNDDGFKELEFVFDPASYGQYLGGTPKVNGNKSTYIDENTYIGQKLLDGTYDVKMDTDENGYRIPYLIKGGRVVTKIYNLHIHSKKLDDFLS